MTFSQASRRNDLNNLTAGIGPITVSMPDWVLNLFTILTAGLYVPQSITVTGVALTLPQALATGVLTLTLTGTVAVSGWFGASAHPFTFTETVALAPSGDPVDAARILAATKSSASITISGGWVLAQFSILANIMAGYVTPVLEGQFNQGIASKVADVLAGRTPPLMLSPQAVISANRVVITPSGLVLILSVADIFGPALVPLQLMVVNATLVGKDNRRRTIRVDVTDAATGAPLAGTLVRIFSNSTGGQTASGNTDQDGSVTLSYPACTETSNGLPIKETSCPGTVIQQGFKDQDFDTPSPLP